MSDQEYISTQENSSKANLNNLLCQFCNSENIVKQDYFETKAYGKRQRYFCKDFKKKFILQNGFYRMHNSPEK